MPGDISPRAAIQTWLIHTNQRKSHSTFHASGARNDKPLIKGKQHQRRHHDKLHASNPRLAETSHHPYNSKDVPKQDPQKTIKRTSHPTIVDLVSPVELRASNPDSPRASLAQRLNLHAPFQAFGHEENASGPELGAPSYSRKRKRVPSSSSSPLEPVVISETSACGSPGPAWPKHSTKTNNITNAMSISSSPSSDTSISTEEPKKTTPKRYERRLRHKTREDRYKIKEDKTQKKEARRKRSKAKDGADRKRGKRTGRAVAHDFKAQNVGQKRLTLGSSKSMGLFGKGRASSPVRRPGLPDLTFSEMTFLTHRKERPQHSEDIEKKTSKRKTAADTEAQISRYFIATAGSKDHPREQDLHKTFRSPTPARSSLPPVDFPERPFLGFGSCGQSYGSQIRTSNALNVGVGHRRSTSARSTSYFTWSPSGRASQASAQLSKPRDVGPSRAHEPRLRGRRSEYYTESHYQPAGQQPREGLDSPSREAPARENQKGVSQCGHEEAGSLDLRPPVTKTLQEHTDCIRGDVPRERSTELAKPPECRADQEIKGIVPPGMNTRSELEGKDDRNQQDCQHSFDEVLQDLIRIIPIDENTGSRMGGHLDESRIFSGPKANQPRESDDDVHAGSNAQEYQGNQLGPDVHSERSLQDESAAQRAPRPSKPQNSDISSSHIVQHNNRGQLTGGQPNPDNGHYPNVRGNAAMHGSAYPVAPMNAWTGYSPLYVAQADIERRKARERVTHDTNAEFGDPVNKDLEPLHNYGDLIWEHDPYEPQYQDLHEPELTYERPLHHIHGTHSEEQIEQSSRANLYILDGSIDNGEVTYKSWPDDGLVTGDSAGFRTQIHFEHSGAMPGFGARGHERLLYETPTLENYGRRESNSRTFAQRNSGAFATKRDENLGEEEGEDPALAGFWKANRLY